MKKNLQDLVYIVLNHLHKVDIATYAQDIANLLEYTTISVFKPYFEEAGTFYQKNNKYPSIEFLMSFLNVKIPDMSHKPFSSEFMDEFYSLVVQESATFQAIQSLHEGDKDKALKFLDFNKSNDFLEKPVYMEDILDLYDAFASNVTGLVTGCSQVDEILRILGNGTMTTIGAFAGEGKTTFLNSIMYHNLLQGKNILLFNLEISQRDCLFNLASREALELGTELFAGTLKKGVATPDEREALKKAMDSFVNKPNMGKYEIITPGRMREFTPSEFTRLVKYYDKEWADVGGVHGILFDYLQLTKVYPIMQIRDEKERMNFWVRFITALCVAMDKAGIMLSQLSRTGRQKFGKTQHGDLSYMSEANEIERSSSVVMQLLSTEANRLGSIMNISIPKHRNGVTHIPVMSVFANYGQFKVGENNFQQVFSLEAFDQLNNPDNPNTSFEDFLFS